VALYTEADQTLRVRKRGLAILDDIGASAFTNDFFVCTFKTYFLREFSRASAGASISPSSEF
jgi:hypothetical protein